MSEKISFDELKKHLWDAAEILYGQLDPSEYRKPIMTMMFLKRLSDQFEEKAEQVEIKLKNKKAAWGDPDYHTFFVPKECRWNEIVSTFENIGEKLDTICQKLERQNRQLEGVLTNVSYNDKKMYPDDLLLKLIMHFNKKKLRNSNLENEDAFGQAYEYLLEQFADSAGKKAGEFFTPREVVKTMIEILAPTEKMKICDPTCGSGGMLIWSRKYIEEYHQNPKNITLHGQERNYGNYGMCKMNMILHGIENFRIEHENVLTTPLLVENGSLLNYDLVIANFPFSMDWENGKAANDHYGRFKFGIPPSKGKADFAFIQHMYSTLNKKGKAAIIASQGVLFRGGEEAKIREEMINQDAIEAIIALPEGLFYGTGIPGCIWILNKAKDEKRKNKILFIYAAKDYREGKNRNKLRDEDTKKIVKAFTNFKDIDKYCHVADYDELKENEFNLNVPRYVDISEPEEKVDVQTTINELKKLEKEREKIESKVAADLKELGFKV